MIKTVNIRTLKDKLSSCLREVQRGDVYLVTDRGRVVAELRQPESHPHLHDVACDREERLVEQGLLKRGLPNSQEAYQLTSGLHLDTAAAAQALGWARGER